MPVAKTIPLRIFAAKVLSHVERARESLDLSMDQVTSMQQGKPLNSDERAWVFEACSQSLRMQGRIRWIIHLHATKKPPTGRLARLVEIAVAQILTQDIPPALVVSETVEAVRESEGEPPARFANALLRKIAEQKAAWREWVFPANESAAAQAAWCSMPQWMFDLLVKERGVEWVKNFAASTLGRPVTWFRLLNGTAELASGVTGLENDRFVQDISNQHLVDWCFKEIASRIKSPASGDLKVLDLCCAPGGKTLAMATHGMRVDATDRAVDRLAKVRENLNRLGLSDRVSILDFKEVWESTGSWDVIWIDAPCSSSGLIQRHPDIRWAKRPGDVQNLVQVQTELLNWAKKHLTSNGMIIYSVCSVFLSEQHQAASFAGLREMAVFESMPFQEKDSRDGLYGAILQA